MARQKNNHTQTGISLTNVLAMIIVAIALSAAGYAIDRYSAQKTQIPAVAAAQTLAYDCEEGKNALEILKTKAEVKTQESSLGAFVDSIDGTANSSDRFWIFYINGEIGTVGADQYQCKANDKIEWRYEKIF